MAKKDKKPRPFGLEFLEPVAEADKKGLNGGIGAIRFPIGGGSGLPGGGLHTMALSLPRFAGGPYDSF